MDHAKQARRQNRRGQKQQEYSSFGHDKAPLGHLTD
jgi:hypothetical protein